MHDTLDVIEKEMLVILSQTKLRSESKQLEESFGDIYRQFMDDENPDYCTKSVPFPLPSIPRVATAVEVTLKEETEQELAENQLHIDLYTLNPQKETMKSLSYNDWANLEKVQLPLRQLLR